ncbi:hypothetical protein ZWY2020_039087 [Hordeum vulgare]|nr:hypothetical protein ZWY2020_039087 [Hordeum vulgare]
MMHHVRLYIEGILVHGWNEYVIAFVIGRKCSLDYIEPSALSREDTPFLSLWAWTSDPNTILKVKWLTLPARGHCRRGRRGLHHRMLLHLDLLEDHSKACDDHEDPPPPDVEEFTWYLHEVDGTTRRINRTATSQLRFVARVDVMRTMIMGAVTAGMARAQRTVGVTASVVRCLGVPATVSGRMTTDVPGTALVAAVGGAVMLGCRWWLRPLRPCPRPRW